MRGCDLVRTVRLGKRARRTWQLLRNRRARLVPVALVAVQIDLVLPIDPPIQLSAVRPISLRPISQGLDRCPEGIVSATVVVGVLPPIFVGIRIVLVRTG